MVEGSIPAKIGWDANVGFWYDNNHDYGSWNKYKASIIPSLDSSSEFHPEYTSGDGMAIDSFYSSTAFHADQDKVKTVLIYADSHFAYVCPGLRKTTLSQNNQTRYYYNAKYEVASTSKYSGTLSSSFSVPMAKVVVGSGTNLGAHRWIKKADFSNIFRGGDVDESSIVYVDRSSSNDISSFAYAESDYARFTGYWEVASTYDRSDSVATKGSLDKSRIQNQVWYPIFKPFAAVVFHLLCTDDFFVSNPGSKRILKFVENRYPNQDD